MPSAFLHLCEVTDKLITDYVQYTGKTCKCLKYTVNYKKTLKLAIKRGYKIYSKNKLVFVTILTVGVGSKNFLDFFIKKYCHNCEHSV